MPASPSHSTLGMPGFCFRLEASARAGSRAAPQAGSTLASVPAPLFPADALEAVPLFAPAGSLLPTRLAQQYFGDRLFNPLTLFIFPGGEGELNSACASSHASSEHHSSSPGLAAGWICCITFHGAPSREALSCAPQPHGTLS